MGGGCGEENACERYLFLSNTEYVFHHGQFVSTKCGGLGSGQALAKLGGAAGTHNDGGHTLLAEHPAQCKGSRRLAAGCGQLAEGINLAAQRGGKAVGRECNIATHT